MKYGFVLLFVALFSISAHAEPASELIGKWELASMECSSGGKVDHTRGPIKNMEIEMEFSAKAFSTKGQMTLQISDGEYKKILDILKQQESVVNFKPDSDEKLIELLKIQKGYENLEALKSGKVCNLLQISHYEIRGNSMYATVSDAKNSCYPEMGPPPQENNSVTQFTIEGDTLRLTEEVVKEEGLCPQGDYVVLILKRVAPASVSL